MFQKKWSVQILQNWSFVLGPIPGYKLLCHPPPLPLLIQGSDVPGASWRCVVVLRTTCWETNHRKAMGFQSLDKVMTQWPPNIVFVSLKAPSTFVVSRISPKPNVNQVISEAIILGTCRCFLYMFPWILGMKTPDDSCRLKLLWFCNNINLASDPHQEKRWETLVGSSGFCILLFGLAWLGLIQDHPQHPFCHPDVTNRTTPLKNYTTTHPEGGTSLAVPPKMPSVNYWCIQPPLHVNVMLSQKTPTGFVWKSTIQNQSCNHH